ncbi:MAG: EamA family transporter [Oscillospiraceae bacterium]|nr:EamA family transporter [Lachnospiraceae bacterium]MBQ6427408.1 EamA family transporter [Oscillospiraceae bacterium]
MLIGAALLWGLAGVCVKSITWGPMAIVAVRSIISLVILLAVKRSFRVKMTRQNLLGAFFMSATSILYISAIKMTTAGTAIVLQYIAPILVFLFAVLFRGRKPRAAEIVLTLSVFAGCVLSFLDSLDFTMLLGNALALLSGFTFAGQLLVMNGQDNEPVDAMILSNFLCFLISVPFLFTEPLDWSAKNIFWLLVLSVFQYGLANLLFSRSIQHVDPVEASLVLTIEPVFNPIPVALFCGEQMSLPAIVGAVMVVAAVTLHGMLPPAESG